MLVINQIQVLTDNYVYIITESTSKITACVDPSVYDDVVNFLDNNDLKLDYILNTHHHNDHVGGNLKLKEKYGCKIIGSFNDQERVPGIDIKLKENDYFSIGRSIFKIIDTPGHTNGHICFYFEEDQVLFSGDTIFSLGCGRLFEGSYEAMTSSLLKIKSLPSKTKIYCGHEYTQANAKFALFLNSEDKNLKKKVDDINKKRAKSIPTVPFLLEEELKFNPFLKFNESTYLNSIGIEDLDEVKNFEKIRVLKDNF
ncbi:MAG: hydroxyacylglutathione hydrolase [Alphaproteobacteria bacterium]